MFPLSPLGLALLMEINARALQSPETSILDILQGMVNDKPALALEAGRALADKLNDLQVLTFPEPGTANIFLGLAFPDGKLVLVPNIMSLNEIIFAITSPLEMIGSSMGIAMSRQWDRIQEAAKTQAVDCPAIALVDANGTPQAIQRPDYGR